MSRSHDFEWNTDESWVWTFQAKNAAGRPLDLTGGALEWAIGPEVPGDPVLVATTVNGMITFTDEANGIAIISISPTDHASVASGEYRHEMRATTSDDVVSTQLDGRVTVDNSVFNSVPGGSEFTFDEAVQDAVAAAFAAGTHTGITITYTDASNKFDFAVATQYTNEMVDDRVNALLVAGSNITLTYNDPANTLTIAASGGGSGSSLGVQMGIRANDFSI